MLLSPVWRNLTRFCLDGVLDCYIHQQDVYIVEYTNHTKQTIKHWDEPKKRTYAYMLAYMNKKHNKCYHCSVTNMPQLGIYVPNKSSQLSCNTRWAIELLSFTIWFLANLFNSNHLRCSASNMISGNVIFPVSFHTAKNFQQCKKLL